MNPLHYTLCVVWLAATYSMAFFIDPELLRQLALEDGPIENVGALGFFLASVVFLLLFFKDPRGNQCFGLATKRNIFYLLLAALFLFAAGEEISWGQRIIGLDTPESLRALNMQSEINLHNLSLFHGRDAEGERKTGIALMLSMNMLFTLFWLTYCVAFPVAIALSARLRETIDRWNLPSFGISVGSLFLLNYAFSKASEVWFGPALRHDIVEIKESNFALLFLLAGIVLVVLQARRSAPFTTRMAGTPLAPRPIS